MEADCSMLQELKKVRILISCVIINFWTPFIVTYFAVSPCFLIIKTAIIFCASMENSRIIRTTVIIWSWAVWSSKKAILFDDIFIYLILCFIDKSVLIIISIYLPSFKEVPTYHSFPLFRWVLVRSTIVQPVREAEYPATVKSSGFEFLLWSFSKT